MAGTLSRAAQSQHRRRGAREQECPHHLGVACPRTGLSGRVWGGAGPSGGVVHRPGPRASEQRTVFHATHTTDCTGIFKVMANQVRPGLTNPARFNGPRESADLIRRQPAYSIRARGQVPFTEAECMAAISTWNPEPKKRLGIGGRPCMNLRPSGPEGRRLAVHFLNIENRRETVSYPRQG
jgi:hypothetical protein